MEGVPSIRHSLKRIGGGSYITLSFSQAKAWRIVRVTSGRTSAVLVSAASKIPEDINPGYLYKEKNMYTLVSGR